MDKHIFMNPGADARNVMQPEGCALVLCNDSVHSFNDVIDALIDVCGHDYVQAEQCAMLIHYRGSLAVKHGLKEELQPMLRKLQRMDYNVHIEN